MWEIIIVHCSATEVQQTKEIKKEEAELQCNANSILKLNPSSKGNSSNNHNINCFLPGLNKDADRN